MRSELHILHRTERYEPCCRIVIVYSEQMKWRRRHWLSVNYSLNESVRPK